MATNVAAQGSISGRVTGPGSVPLPHPVLLQFYDFNGSGGGPVASTNTDASGNYSINLPASTYGVFTQNVDGYINQIYNNIPCSVTCDVSAISGVVVTNSAVSGIDFVLTPGGGRIAGKVTQADGTTPIAGVRVFFVGPDGEIPFTSAVTDASGNYISEGGSATGLVFAVTWNTPLFQDELYPNILCLECDFDDVLPGGANIPVTMGMTTGGIDFALDAGGSISGTVTNSSGVPLRNITVNIHDATGEQVIGDLETDAAGHYTTGGLPPGNYFATTEHAPGLVDELYDNIPCPNGFCDVLTSGGTPIPVVVGAITSGRNFVLSPGGTISGTVTNALGGAPIQAFIGLFTVSGGQTIYVGGSWSNPDNGAYSVVVLPGTYFEAILNNDDGFANQIYNGLPCPSSCNIQAGTPIVVTTGATTSNINFALTAGSGTISGTVTVGGVLTPNLQVQVLSASGTTLGFAATNASGVYTFSGLAVGSYYVRTNGSSGAINQLYNGVVCVLCNVTTSGGTLVPVTANTTTAINFALTPGGRISGTVTGPGGPTSGMSVQFFTAAGVSVGSATTNASGFYTSIFGLPAGSYRVRTAATATQNLLDEVWNDILCVPCNVQAGAAVAVAGTATTPNINFALAAGGSISGTVTDTSAGGAPVSGVGVTVFDVNGVLVKNTTTDGAGNYTLSGLPNGNYFVRTNPLILGAQLYNGLPYTGLPLVGTPVSVTVGTTHTGVNFPLVSGGSISGTVKDAVSNAPIAGVQVAVYTSAGRLVKFPLTDATGAYTVNGLAAGTYYVSTSVPFIAGLFYIDELYDNAPCVGCATVSAAALNNVTLPCTGPCVPPVTTGTPVVVTNGATHSGVNFLLATGAGAITGTVTDAATGNGLLNVQVQVYNAAGVLVKNVTTAQYTGGLHRARPAARHVLRTDDRVASDAVLHRRGVRRRAVRSLRRDDNDGHHGDGEHSHEQRRLCVVTRRINVGARHRRGDGQSAMARGRAVVQRRGDSGEDNLHRQRRYLPVRWPAGRQLLRPNPGIRRVGRVHQRALRQHPMSLCRDFRQSDCRDRGDDARRRDLRSRGADGAHASDAGRRPPGRDRQRQPDRSGHALRAGLDSRQLRTGDRRQ